jgi:hypothetical protein
VDLPAPGRRGGVPVAADPVVPVVGLREVERNLQGLTMGIPPLRRGGRASAFVVTYCRGAGECQFSVEARSAHSGVLHSAPCGAGRLEFSVWHVFCTLSGEVVWVDEPNISYSYKLFDVM